MFGSVLRCGDDNVSFPVGAGSPNFSKSVALLLVLLLLLLLFLLPLRALSLGHPRGKPAVLRGFIDFATSAVVGILKKKKELVYTNPHLCAR